jgi:tRNA nucleotidyltransferase (CCA-adding enzyme)
MKVYRVGGSVRDELLGLPVQDRDWVVVGTTPEQMAAQGFKPVGRDFPVFLHPQTHEEYALARTERKAGRGYRGFVVHCAPEVTLEDDLRRRDLTINAMARDASGQLIDPWGGQEDLRRRILRHVSEAFAEDPVRILRTARFAARFEDFEVAPSTQALMHAMVQAGEVDALIAERVWQEIATGLMERAPERMFRVLIDCGALPRLLPELSRAWDELPRSALIRACSDAGLGLYERYASLTLQINETTGPTSLDTACSDRLRVPVPCRDFARLAVLMWPHLRDWSELQAQQRLAAFEAGDALRRPERALGLAQWARAAAQILDPRAAPSVALGFERDLAAARGIDAGHIAQAVSAGAATATPHQRSSQIAAAVRAARIGALERSGSQSAAP